MHKHPRQDDDNATEDYLLSSSGAAAFYVTRTYGWDGEDLLSTVTDENGVVTTMVYTADGMRQRKVTPTGSISYVRDGENVLFEADGSGMSEYQRMRHIEPPVLWKGSFNGWATPKNRRLNWPFYENDWLFATELF